MLAVSLVPCKRRERKKGAGKGEGRKERNEESHMMTVVPKHQNVHSVSV
jgi:hypothetical protein